MGSLTTFRDVVDVQAALLDHLSSEVECSQVSHDRVSCAMPLDYPDGDAVVVFVVTPGEGDTVIVTDFGETAARIMSPAGSAQPKKVRREIERLCQRRGTIYSGGRIALRSRPRDVGRAVWQVALASHLVVARFQAQASGQGKKDDPSGERFSQEVAAALRGCSLEVRQEHPHLGLSGHAWKATLYVPSVETLVEPVPARSNWSAISGVFTKFADVAGTNGYRCVSVLDDRTDHPRHEDERARLLTQVSFVGWWTDRDEWLERAFLGRRGGSG